MRRGWLGWVVCGGLVASAAWWCIAEWNYRTRIDRAGRLLKSGDAEAARGLLRAISARWPNRSEWPSLLGTAEAETGHVDAALAAWARAPLAGREGFAIALRRGRYAFEHDRFASAEESLERVLEEPKLGSEDARQARSVLARLYRYEGRLDEVSRLLELRARDDTDPSRAVREHWLLDAEAFPLEGVRGVLDRAVRAAPDDDRVWLAIANWNVRAGRFDEAGRWLSRCEHRRPEDEAVSRTRLAWAVAVKDPAAARGALAHLPPARFRTGELPALEAWAAALRGDHERERTALTRCLAVDPGRVAALERLAELASISGQTDRAPAYLRRKAEIDKHQEHYRKLLAREDVISDAAELAKLAEALGRRFESIAWARLALRRTPGDTELRALLQRLDHPDRDTGDDKETLVALLQKAEGRSTAESTLSGALPRFTEVAQAKGLHFVFNNGQSPLRQLPETMSGGVAIFDADGDGWVDVYAAQGGPFPPSAGRTGGGDRLFRNRGDGSYEDITELAGLGQSGGYTHGIAVGDYDNDGRADLFITRWGSYTLYRNRGGGRFEDVTASAGLGGDRDWPTSAAWADFDGDGDLDLYVCHYLRWNAEKPKVCRHPETGRVSYCDPRGFSALPDHLFRNDGGHFVDVTHEAGIVDRDGRGLGVVAADLDSDGLIDLFVANDTTANYFFRNLGGFRFEECGLESGLAANANGGYQAGMGIACGDFDRDGLIDLAVTNFYGESTTFYHNLGGGRFSDHTAVIGLAAPSRYLLGFGVAFLDVNNDGRLDLLSANGHVTDYRPAYAYAMPAQLLVSADDGRLVDVNGRAGPPFLVARVGRGLAVGDLDNDGRLDALVVSQDGPLAYFHNQTPGGHFVAFRLIGTSSNHDGVGARVTLRANSLRQTAWRCGGGSYLSASDVRLHFGLGPAGQVESVDVNWPSGHVDRFGKLAVDRVYILREGSKEASLLTNFVP
jgi:tetratricopeptide (TPR) repeat protein